MRALNTRALVICGLVVFLAGVVAGQLLMLGAFALGCLLR
jgi:hypothetical protein